MYKGDHQKGEIEIVQERPVYQNDFATFYDDEVCFPAGKKGRYIRLAWKAPYGVAIFAKDQAGRVLLVRNFRHETRSWHWEIPKGFGIEGMSPEECALKELQEETGFIGLKTTLFKEVKDRNLITYLIEVELSQDQKTAFDREEGEAISDVRFFEHDDLWALIHHEEVSDGMTLFYLALAQAQLI